jgi:trimeric autotransporter adhesin
MKKLLSCLSFFVSVYAFAQIPANNDFVNATPVPTTSTCVSGSNLFTTGQTVSASTNEATTITGNACTSPTTNRDVWYRFTTQTEFPVISVTPTGTSWTTAQRINIQILSGTALTSLTEVGCGRSAGTAPTLPATINNTPVVVSPSTELTPGTTYYVRISTTGTPTGANFGYSICIREGTASRMGEVFRQTILSAPTLLNYPWEVTYGPDDSLWITEARGYRVVKINKTNGGKRTVLDLSTGSTWLGTGGTGDDTLNNVNVTTGQPGGWAQGGFAGMALHPQFGTGASKDFVYVTYVHRYLSGTSPGGIFYRNKIVRFTYNNTTNRLGSPAIIANDLPGSKDHNSQRLIITPVTVASVTTYYLFMASGDMGSGQYENRFRAMNAENINSYEGKILRFNLEQDGDAGANSWIPNDNPYNTLVGAQSAVWNIGMRNNQGFAYDTATKTLYGSSHGAYSDDEINIIEGFKHYGHPRVIGYADGNYNGSTTYTNATSGTPTIVSAGSDGSSCNPTPFVPPAGYGFVSPYCGQSTAPPIGNEATNVTTINAGANGQYRDPLFSAYAPNSAAITATWQSPGNNANWRSEGWSGLDIYSNSIIPGWKRSLVASGLKWGRLIKLNLNAAGTATLPSNVTGSSANEGDTVTYFQSTNRYRDLAMDPNGKDIYIVMDNSSATSGPGVGNPTVPGCQGCLIKYSFLGYVIDGSKTFGASTIPKSIAVTTGTANTCNSGNTITIDATNNKLWVPITGPDGNIMAEINANGNNLGDVTSFFYIKSGGIRSAGGKRYLDRNITITPQFQPTLPSGNPLVKIRLYITKAEFDALDADALSGISTITDLKILKNNDACGAAIASNTLPAIAPTNTTVTNVAADYQHGPGNNGYVIQGDISSFSSFYFGSASITLPVGLIAFNGSLQPNGSALLNWKTANEQNSSHFIIERSADGNNFNTIGRVAASGTTTVTNNYSYTDNDAAAQQLPQLYYRLKIMDNNGEFSYSNVVVISFASLTKVSVYPIPAHNSINVNIVSPVTGNAQLQVIDNSGHIVLQRTAQLLKGGNDLSIDLQKLATGFYYLKVTGNGIDKKVKIQKL